MIYENDRFKLECTGRTFYANGYIGIMEIDYGEVVIAEGYDGYVRPEPPEEEGEPDSLDQQERVELADYMISLWERFKK